MVSVFDTLKERGYLAQVTHEEELKQALENGQVTFYMGFDPTADSLHVGHFLALMAMSHMQKAGHRPICLVGGGTGTVGDPSGRTDMRKMLTDEDIEYNCNCFKKQMERFIDFSDGKALMINNGEWLRKLNYIELLRDVGPHFSVNRMLAAEYAFRHNACTYGEKQSQGRYGYSSKRIGKGMHNLMMAAHEDYHIFNNEICDERVYRQQVDAALAARDAIEQEYENN